MSSRYDTLLMTLVHLPRKYELSYFVRRDALLRVPSSTLCSRRRKLALMASTLRVNSRRADTFALEVDIWGT